MAGLASKPRRTRASPQFMISIMFKLSAPVILAAIFFVIKFWLSSEILAQTDELSARMVRADGRSYCEQYWTGEVHLRGLEWCALAGN